MCIVYYSKCARTVSAFGAQRKTPLSVAVHNNTYVVGVECSHKRDGVKAH